MIPAVVFADGRREIHDQVEHVVWLPIGSYVRDLAGTSSPSFTPVDREHYLLVRDALDGLLEQL